MKKQKICSKIPCGFSIENYKIIFIFLFPIFGVVYNRIRDKNANVKNEYFYIQLYFISYLFSFIPLLIYLIKYRTKKEKNIEPPKEEGEEENNLEKNAILQFISRRNKIKKIKSIVIIICLCSIGIAFRYFDWKGNTDKKTIGLVYKIPILFLLSYFILKYRYYRHHYTSLVLIILTLLTKYLLGVIQSDALEWVKQHIWLYFLFSLSHSLLLVLGKYFMDEYDKTPYFLMFIIGIINSFILISTAIIKYLVTSESDIFSGFTNYIDSYTSLLLFLADIFSQFLYNLGSWITVYYFTPLHTIISENAIEIYYNIYDIKSNIAYWEEKGYVWNMWVIPIILVLNLIFSFIFNEIIILKCCKFDYNTRIKIEERERRESNKLFNVIDKSFDTDLSNLTSLTDEIDE